MKKEYWLYLFLIVSPLFQGLYFEYTVCFADLFLVLYLGGLWISNKRLKFGGSLDLKLLFGVVGYYVITTFFAVDKGTNIYGIMKVMEPALLYLVLMQIEFNKKDLVRVITISGVVVAVASIIALSMRDFSGILIKDGRFEGLFEYANTYALYILVTFIVSQQDVMKARWRIVLNCLFILTIAFTYSRSVIILMGLVILYITLNSLWNGIVQKRDCLVPRNDGGRELVISLVICAVIFFIITNINGVNNRITQINLSKTEFQARLLYYRDSVEIIKNNIFGLGYDGYYYVQGMYQTGIYKVRLVHNSVLQVALEIGIVGLILYGVILGRFLIGRFRRIDRKFDYLDVAFLIIAIHSLFDFDLSFLAVVNVLILIIWVNNAQCTMQNKKLEGTEKHIDFKTLIGGCLILGIVVVSVALAISGISMRNGNYGMAVMCYSYNTEAYTLKANEYFKNGDIINAKVYIKKAESMNEKSLETLKIRQKTEESEKNLDGAIKTEQEIMSLDMLNIEEVEKYSGLLLEKVHNKYYNDEERKECKKQIANIREYVAKVNGKISGLAYKQKRVPFFTMTKRLIENEKEALKY